ncbi:MAG: hypothetical protein ACXAEF_12240 [Candidatus Thorarchaeota archaeon]|jgi:hypothetical protein
MSFLKNKMAVGAILVAIIGVSSLGVLMALNMTPPDTSVSVTLLENAGVMIEANGERIYIDPYLLPDNQTEFPADGILVELELIQVTLFRLEALRSLHSGCIHFHLQVQTMMQHIQLKQIGHPIS